jgi:hypothetical protein
VSSLIPLVLAVVALAFGLALGRAACGRWGRDMPRWLPAAVLVPGLLPLAWHFRRIADFIAPVPSLAGPAGAEAQLEMLSLALPFTVVAVWGLAVLAVRRIPVLAVAFPAVATLLYLEGMKRFAPLVSEAIHACANWLAAVIAAQVPVTCAMAAFLWTALGRDGLFMRWPLRSR